MGLKATVAAAVTAAFSALGDLVETATLQQPSTLDPVTEAETPGATTTISVVEGNLSEAARYFSGLNWRGVAGEVQSADAMVLADANETGLAFLPDQDQTLTWRSDTYIIHRVDPVQESLLQVYLRKAI